MSAPEVKFSIVEAHIGADPAFTREFGQRVKDCGGKYSDIRGGSSTRYVTVPAAERTLLNEILAKALNSRTVLVLRDFHIDGVPSERVEAVVRRAMGTPVCYWRRKDELPSDFAANFVREKMSSLPWNDILKDWAAEDAKVSNRLRQVSIHKEIADLKDQIAYEAARIAEGANDWDTIRDLGSRYSDLCSEAGIDLSISPEEASLRA